MPGTSPFSMSPASVRMAAFLPPRRSTLVVPGLREPFVRGSGRPMSLQTTIAAEIDPNR
jgi:hypothetical protein